MEINMTEAPRENPDFSKESVEQHTCEAILAALAVFNESPIKMGLDGVYLTFAGRHFLLSVEINLVREVTVSELPD